jgi:uncharacterized membrane protein YcgQ (UPF0703/DUF1980 family)
MSSSAASDEPEREQQQEQQQQEQQQQQQQQPNDIVPLTTDNFADVIERQAGPALVSCSINTTRSKCATC